MRVPARARASIRLTREKSRITWRAGAGAARLSRASGDYDDVSPPADTAGPTLVLREAPAGLVVGLDIFGRAIALVTLIFTGGLAAGLAVATTVFLLAGAVGTMSLILRRDLPGRCSPASRLHPSRS